MIGYIFQCVLRPSRTAAESQRPFIAAYRVKRTRNESTDSEEPRVDIEKTRGLRRWIALYITAFLSIAAGEGPLPLDFSDTEARVVGRISVLRSWYISTPFTRSHSANKYFPNEGCSHPFGVTSRASSGV